MRRFSDKSGYNTMTELNVTPMLDLAFVLLIIFIITTPLMENSIEINLPTATPTKNQPETPPTFKTVSVNRRAQIYLDSTPVSASQLAAELAQIKAEHPDLAVILKLDRDLRVQSVTDVLSALSKANVTRFAWDFVDSSKP